MINNSIEKKQISAIHAILQKNGMMEEKQRIILEISNGRCSSTKDLTFEEAQQWINAMNAGKPRHELPDVQKEKRQRMINALVAMAREMQVITRHQVITDEGKLVLKSDYSTFNEWLQNKSCVKKENLNAVTYKELPMLVAQYKAIHLDWVKSR